MVFINPAHGGYDNGGGSNIFFKEKDLAFKISKYQVERLNELGIEAILVRNDDYFLSTDDRITLVNNQANENDILLSNHLNYGEENGIEIIYSVSTKATLPNLICDKFKEKNHTIRNAYQKFDRTGLDFYDILKYPKCNDKLIIYYGFSDNDQDVKKLLYHWMDLAEIIVKSLADYLKIDYTKPTKSIYIVKKIESVDDVAEKFKTSPEKLKKDNNLSTDILYPNTEIIINTK